MKHCPHCHHPLSFMAVIVAINPARIKCSKCKQVMHIHTPHAVVAFCLATLCAVGIIVLMAWQGLGNIPLFLALGTVGLVLELGYFTAINKGLVKSNLVDANQH